MRIDLLKFDYKSFRLIGMILLTGMVVLVSYWITITRCKGNCNDGLGTKRFLNGNTYIGQWRNGKQDGYGLLLSKEKKILHNGKWMDGEPAEGGFQLNSNNLKRKKNE